VSEFCEITDSSVAGVADAESYHRLRPCGSAWGGRPASGGKNLVISVV